MSPEPALNNNSIEVALQQSIDVDPIEPLPSEDQFKQWVHTALTQTSILRQDLPLHLITESQPIQITLRIVDSPEMVELNRCYRDKNRPTNVLSFPFEAPEGIPLELLEEISFGDIIICAAVIAQESKEQQKSTLAHWAHMVIHGTLHLMGYDHINSKDAEIMESIEVNLLKELGFTNNPYHPLQPPSRCSATLS